MKIHCLRTEAEFLALSRRWNPLLQVSGSNSIFLTWEWVSTWWAVFGKRFRLLLLIAEDTDGQLIGIAPTMIGKLRSATRMNFHALMLLGQQGDTTAEYLDFIITRGHEKQITDAFCSYFQNELATEWDYIHFEHILTTSPNLPTLANKLSSPRFATLQSGESKSPFATLTESWEEFLTAKSRNFRSQWNNSWNRLQADGDVKFLFAGKDLPVDTALVEVARLHRERWAEESGSFRSDDYLRFHKMICERFHSNGWLVLLLLAVNDKNVAVRYDYVYAQKLWCMQGGWSPEYAAKRVGTLLTGKVIEWGIEHRLMEYDFLGGDSDYKRRWSNGERVMINLTAANVGTFRGWLWQCNLRLEDALRRLKNMFRRPPQKPAVSAEKQPSREQ